jgi:N,N-dimethylformamidase
MLKLLSYADKLSVAPGETVNIKVSSEEETPFHARLVRVIHGDANPDGPGVNLVHVPASFEGFYPGRRQSVDAGSCTVVDPFPAPDLGQGWTFSAMIWPTLLARDEQTIAAQWNAESDTGVRLSLKRGGFLELFIATEARQECLALSRPMLERHWYFVRCTVGKGCSRLSLSQTPVLAYARTTDADEATLEIEEWSPSITGPFTLAGLPIRGGGFGVHFNGKIEGPLVLASALDDVACRSLLDAEAAAPNELVARWRFELRIGSEVAEDSGPNALHGRFVNLPARAMKGHNWTGDAHSWRLASVQYGAVHFHEDDLYDAGWETSFSWTAPQDLKSGAYAIQLRAGESGPYATREDLLPVFVRPPRGAKPGSRPPVAFLAPTASYMAYANESQALTGAESEIGIGRLIVLGHGDMFLHAHPEFGGSLYDKHADGSGVCTSSRLRPIINMRPRYHSWIGAHGSGLWQYNADTHLLDWLDHLKIDFDVITDEDLHAEGAALLEPYRVLITGTHPEYHSTAMWDGLKTWQDASGRLMYLGGDGWYWRVAFHSTLPGVIEVRRAEDGIRTWEAMPGEYFHAFTGEYGGLWRRIGRPPNMICGVGFVAQGFDVCSYYRRRPEADDPRVAFIFESVPDEVIGNFGLVGGGAAGLELDCANLRLGTPPNALRLAVSEGHSDLVLLVKEEFGVTIPNIGGEQNDRVHADLVFYETPSGGAVFSVGSIAWCGSLSHNGYDNNVSHITANVLRRFSDPAPFEV